MSDKTTKKITISGEIGWDYTSTSIRDSLREAKGGDIELEIASPGGDVFDGIEIYNAIRDYKRDNPKSQIMATLKGLVASMASYIASNPAIDLVAAEDNAVYMIHNPWMLAMGDYREMVKQSAFLEGLAGILASAYVERTGKKETEIRSLMDSETWLFGSEMKDAGFVDEMVASVEGACGPDTDKKKKALALARGSFDAMKRHAQEKTDAQKVAAMVQTFTQAIAPGVPGEIDTPESQGGTEMFKTLAEFKTENLALYTEFESGAKASAVTEERARIVALLDMKKKHGEKVGAVAELVDKAVASGQKVEDIALAVVDLVAAAADSVGPLNTGANGTASGETTTTTTAKPVGYAQ